MGELGAGVAVDYYDGAEGAVAEAAGAVWGGRGLGGLEKGWRCDVWDRFNYLI